MDTNFSGTYTSIAAIVVFILSKLGVNVQISDILAIIAAIALVAGIVKQARDHYKLGKVVETVTPTV